MVWFLGDRRDHARRRRACARVRRSRDRWIAAIARWIAAPTLVHRELKARVPHGARVAEVAGATHRRARLAHDPRQRRATVVELAALIARARPLLRVLRRAARRLGLVLGEPPLVELALRSLVFLCFIFATPTPGGAGASEAAAGVFFADLLAPADAIIVVAVFRAADVLPAARDRRLYLSIRSLALSKR